MKANELRVGNYVKTSMSDVDRVQRVGIWCYTDCSVDEIETESMQPIPLTEEWLLNFGFTRLDKFRFRLFKNANTCWINTEIFSAFCDGICICSNLDYVHQLQNLYFALTGEELKEKPAVDAAGV